MKHLILAIFALVLLGCGASVEDRPYYTLAEAEDRPYSTLAESEIVCAKCSAEQLVQESEGIRKAARALIEYAGGSDILPDSSPITVHVSEDEACQPQSDEFAYAGYLNICLFSYERHANKCDDCAPVTELPSQTVMVHEGLHEWFRGRVENNYGIEEGFCQYAAFDATNALEFINSQGHDIDTNPCRHIVSEHTALIQELCALGIASNQVRQTLKQTDETANRKGVALTTKEFAGVVSVVMGLDAEPAFRKAGLL